MPVTEFKILSRSQNFPFNTALEDFFDNYEIIDDVECYQLFFCPNSEGTSFDDLNKLKFKSPIVILNVIDSIIDKENNIAIDELKKFCDKNQDQQFILFNSHLRLNDLLNIKNLYSSTILSITFNQRYQACEKKDITNKWIFLNSYPRTHRIACISYLLSKKYYKNGYISYNNNYEYLLDTDSLPEFIKKDIKTGYQKFKLNRFNRLSILPYKNDNIKNYNSNLISIYKRIAVEIVSGSMFFQPISLVGEKEIQSIYAKNFSIFINSVGAVGELKKFFNIDMFDDIIDHSYDTVIDPFKRIKLAIDKNKKLLNGSINMKELWFDNQKRFDENCKKLDSILCNQLYQTQYNEKIITTALDHFAVSYKRKYNDNSK